MKIAVTGATGFIGLHLTAASLRQGIDVVALARRDSPALEKLRNDFSSQLQIQRIDLLHAEHLAGAFDACDAVVHLAAAMQGENQLAQTLETTKNALQAASAVNIKKFIGLSSIAVLDFIHTETMSTIDESLAYCEDDKALGPYAHMKREQEKLVHDWQENAVVILRPGLVYDERQLSAAHAGITKGKRGLVVDHSGQVPLAHVDNVCGAILAAIESATAGEIFHIVDSALPSQGQYLSALRSRGVLTHTLALSWPWYARLTRLLRASIALLGRTPDSFCRNSIAARQKPFRFSNEKIKARLNWQPEKSLSL